jgi:hypothetical protein
MRAIRIMDTNERGLSFDLVDLLREVGDRLSQTEWEVDHVQSSGESAEDLEQLEALETLGHRVTGDRLMQIATRLYQVVWGNFRGFRPDQTKPWIIISAFDSSWFDVVSDDDSLIEQLKKQFKKVTDVPTE